MSNRINASVYDLIVREGLKFPDIPVHEVEIFGQCGEDLIVCGLLRALACKEGLDLSAERYLEVGANHPVSCNATYLLHRKFGMRGVLVEANPALLTDLCRFREADQVLHLAITPEGGPTATLYVSNQDELSSLDRRFVTEWRDGAVGLRDAIIVPSLTLTALLEREFVARSPIFLSIDIEGMDLAVLQTVDWSRWRPAVIQTEPSEHHLPGNTGALTALLEGAGYAVVAQTDVNLVAIDAARAGLVTDPLVSKVTALHTSLFEQTNLVADLRHQLTYMREDSDSRITVLTQRSEEDRKIRAELGHQLAQVLHRLDEANEMLAGVRTVVRVREEQLAESEAQCVAADDWARTLEEKGRSLHSKIDELHRSSSWRLTAPLRALAGLLKGERHRR